MIRDRLTHSLRAALSAAGLPEPSGGATVDVPRHRDQGDFSTSVALQLTKATGMPARELAEKIRDALLPMPSHVVEIDIAGPGFINFHLDSSWTHDVLREVVAAGPGYGRSDALSGQRINLEFVSANPTGPLHAGGGRWVAVGDAIANLLAAQGADVHREYYLNDAGTQLDMFAASLLARARGEEPPDGGYLGTYLVDMAARMRAELGDDATLEAAREWGYAEAVQQLRDDLGRIGVYFDTWFSERTLHELGEVDDVLRALDEAGHTFEQDGARWLRTTEFGDARDRVIVRSNGTPTYLASDLAYHRNKVRRGFAHLIDIWGADHHGQVKSLQAGMQALGYGPPPEPEILLGQLVKLVRGGQEVRLSKRAGDIVALADILDLVDPDVVRMTFLLLSLDSAQTFDLEVVTSQSMENPVYYVQYAHARVASIERKAVEAGVVRKPLEAVDLGRLEHPAEHELLRALDGYPDVVAEAAELRAPQKLSTWVREFASRFHSFYRECRVLTDDAELTQARLWLVESCRIGLGSALGLLGVSAPEAMARLDGADDDDDLDLVGEAEAGS
ncbi:MAG: arginyl-tRNA synthetase [Actinomycetota bacterium]|nr:arginyl-tRNA synthetase [Actinomycetota bacterium]